MTPTIPNRDDPRILRALLNDARDSYARLMVLTENTLQGDPVREAAQALAFQKQIQETMTESELRLASLMECIEPWSERRRVYPGDVAAEVDKFLDLLQKGLTGLLSQIEHRVELIQSRQTELRETLEKLNQQRQGIQGYRPGSAPRSRYLDDKT
jgi:cell division septum initiation protein DivIVA